MPSSYTPSLKLILQATGENNGSWGTLTNSDFTSLVDIAVAGYESIAMADADRTLTNGDGAAANEARYAFINMTGALTAARNVIVPTASKLYFFKNATTGGFAITLKTSGGTGISIPNGKAMVLMCDGTNVIDAVTAFSSLNVNGTLSGGTSGTGYSFSGSAPATSLALDTSGNLGIGTTSPAAKLSIVGSAATTPSAVTFSATAMAVNCLLSNVFTTTFTANVTVAPTFSNLADGQTINWFITQDGTGGRTMTWPTSFKWPGGVAALLSTNPNAVDLLVATYRASTGFWYATLSNGFA